MIQKKAKATDKQEVFTHCFCFRSWLPVRGSEDTLVPWFPAVCAVAMEDESHSEGRAQDLFDQFVLASTCRATLSSFNQLCQHLQLDCSTAERPLFRPLKSRLNYWRSNALWAKLERRAVQHERLGRGACTDTTCVVIGAGPCGLRTAVELSFMGARVVLLEKRDSFSRNNVLHLWPFTIHDLRSLGAKKFYGKFCAGSIDHISIRQLQLVLLKVALLLGVEVHVNVEFKKLLEPPKDQRRKVGWRMEVSPSSHPVSQLEFNVIVGADGRRNTLPGFRRKEFRGKLAIAITANFRNRNSRAEAKVQEISGVAFIFNQRFFKELRQKTGIDLENIVYYKDDTHYFVMTAKKQSLLDKGVILQDFVDTEQLLSTRNVDQNALQAYALMAADFSTNYRLPSLDFAMNHYGQPDVAMFDFTCMYASENAAIIRQRHGHQLLVSLVGDSLLEPFWPMGTGIARGFLAALDSAWMMRSWAQGRAPLDVLAERESLYRLLPQTTPENMQKNISLFTVDPATRYMNISPLTVTPSQVRHLMDTGEEVKLNTNSDIARIPPPQTFSQTNQLLTWCQEQTAGYCGVSVTDLTTSWKSGLALCALIHQHRPDLINFDSLDETLVEENTRLGFDVAEREFGIAPLMTVEEMSCVDEPDSLSMVMYLSQFYQLLKDSPSPAGCLGQIADFKTALIAPASLLSRLGTSPSRKRNQQLLSVQVHRDTLSKQRRITQPGQEPNESCDLNDTQVSEDVSAGGAKCSRVRQMANELQAKLDESLQTCRTSLPTTAGPQEALVSSRAELLVSSSAWRPNKRTLQQQQMSFRFREKIKNQSEEQFSAGSSDICFFCKQKVYVMERLSAEGFFFHRSCFQCDSCRTLLRPPSYTFELQSRRFYCLQHSECQLISSDLGIRPSHSDPASSQCPSIVSLSAGPPLSDSQASTRRSSAASVMTTPPERTELELWDVQEEVSEETLNRFNLCEEQSSSVQEEVIGHTSEESRASCPETSAHEEETTDAEIAQLDSVSSPAAMTPPHSATPSTVSFITKTDSIPDQESGRGVVSSASGRGSFDKITPELPQKKNLSLYEWEAGTEGEESESEGAELDALRKKKRRRHKRADSNALHVKRHQEAPPPGLIEVGAGKCLWRAVFSRQEQKKTASDVCIPKKTANQRKITDMSLAESDLDLMMLLRSYSLKPQNIQGEVQNLTEELQRATINTSQEPVYVPHALAFGRSYGVLKHAPKEKLHEKLQSDGLSSCSTETVGVIVQPKELSSLSIQETLFQSRQADQDQCLDSKVSRRVRRASQKQARQEQLKRLHKAQMIQRQLQQVEEKQKHLEEQGVMVEKALRGEADYWEDWGKELQGGLNKLKDPVLMQQWFQLVLQKNSLARYEAELIICAKELELEDRQRRLQQELREQMLIDDHLKGAQQLEQERLILEEMLEVVEQRNALVSLLEEQRLQDGKEYQNQDLEPVLLSGLGLSWT
ncbi:F-actin-monooxygenase MICAL3-like isoform X3 [Gouania willdenowi]|uniref:F-actin-monooxygenase MICAL3-like isoform X3 n=1 Tax=Gouania willdenowi TaxID=441366 RepID=UPI0010558855|nr:F-actin-monooxygenase MICAL3-like isoform X3 [Gouania willdenowi]